MAHDIERFAFNRCVAQMHVLANGITDYKEEGSEADHMRLYAMRHLAILLSVIAPHISEELWQATGGSGLVVDAAWPEVDAALLEDDEVEIGVQVNGKLRARIQLPKDCPKDKAESLALALPEIEKHLNGQPPKKVIVVPNRIINVVG